MDNSKKEKPALVSKNLIIPFILLTSCFAWWGLSNNMTDPLVKAFTGIFKDLSTFQSSLIQFAFYGAYACLAIPGALIVRRFSYKTGVLAGLGLYIIGGLLFYPATIIKEFWFFCFAFYVLAGGLSILETAANPYVLKLGDDKTATQRLNLAQSFNPVGSVAGTLACQFFILARLENLDHSKYLTEEALQTAQLNIVVLPYLAVAFILILIWIGILSYKMPAGKDTEHVSYWSSMGRLIKNPKYVFSVIAQFFYVGAQIGVWTLTIFYIMEKLSIDGSTALQYHTIALVLFGLTRFVCTGLMSFIKPATLLIIMSILAGCCTIAVILGNGIFGVVALIGISVCMSLMFPTIYGLGLESVDKNDTKVGASFLVMAILGGAILTPLQSLIKDATSVSISYIIPLICFSVIALFAIFSKFYKAK